MLDFASHRLRHAGQEIRLTLVQILVGVVILLALTALTGAPWTWSLLAALVYAVLTFGLMLWRRRESASPRLGPSAAQTLSGQVPAAAPRNEILGSALRLADSFNEGIVTVDQNGRILNLNISARKLFPTALLGQSMISIIRNPALKDVIEDTVAGRPVEPLIYHINNPVEQHFRITASLLDPVPDRPGNDTLRVNLVFYDVTDIERANTLRADFLANASHELKTPVASLLGYIETLNGHAKDDPEARDMFLGIMRQQAERMQRLIDDLLSLRRIELIEHIAPTETGDLYLAARAASEAVMPIAEARDIKVKYSGSKHIPVIGKQDELVQLILNIVDNAVQMSPPGTKVHMNSHILENWQPGDGFNDEPVSPNATRRRIINPPNAGEDYAVIRIRDHASGFKREHLPRLTERFYRIAGDRDASRKGTGLGLAIVKHITMRHRGGLLIESAENVGTEFTIMIPVSHDEDKTDPSQPKT